MARKILVVDDERHIVRLIRVELERAGYEVVPAFDGKEALEEVELKDPGSHGLLSGIGTVFLEDSGRQERTRPKRRYRAIAAFGPYIHRSFSRQDRGTFESRHEQTGD